MKKKGGKVESYQREKSPEKKEESRTSDQGTKVLKHSGFEEGNMEEEHGGEGNSGGLRVRANGGKDKQDFRNHHWKRLRIF